MTVHMQDERESRRRKTRRVFSLAVHITLQTDPMFHPAAQQSNRVYADQSQRPRLEGVMLGDCSGSGSVSTRQQPHATVRGCGRWTCPRKGSSADCLEPRSPESCRVNFFVSGELVGAERKTRKTRSPGVPPHDLRSRTLH